jgi:plasmid maintenance system antidote protein VapI/Zn-dependent peptidase ImmA (M78 family)
MTSAADFKPDWISPPGDTIGTLLRERQMTLDRFAAQMQVTMQTAQDLLVGNAAITLSIARSLKDLLGASVEFWMARDHQYHEQLVHLRAEEAEWLEELPIDDMVRFGWIARPAQAKEKDALLAYFGSTSVRAWRDQYASVADLVAFRTSPTFDSHPSSVAAWLRQGELISQGMNCAPWNAERFLTSLAEIRALTRLKEPQHFVPKLQAICAASGVAVVIVRSPDGCRASGATFFSSETKAVLLLSFRYLTDDHFWFTFFHEAAHLLLHSQRTLTLEGVDKQNSQDEIEANDFASRILIPTEIRSQFDQLRSNTMMVIKFASKAGIAPGIVVGQLQHRGVIGRDQLNRLKRRFEWSEDMFNRQMDNML